MRVIILVIATFFIAYSVESQPCKIKYKDKLESSSKLIDCGGNFTIEKLKNGSCILKRYYPETRQLTHLATFKSKKLKELHGPYIEYWDDGTLVTQGMFSNHQKVGVWIENEKQSGYYENDLREGEWTIYGNDSLVLEVKSYSRGVQHGESIRFDSLGRSAYKEVYQNGLLISSTKDTINIVEETMPRFPGCENMGLSDADLQICAQRKMLEYVYGNLKYPKKARKLNVQGRALIQFTILKDGSVTNLKALHGVSKDIKEEVFSLIKKMPNWHPGLQNGMPVNVQFTMPIKFNLE